MFGKLKSLNYFKILKIALGAAIAILIADFLGLKYYTATGIITVLTIYDTKKETLIKALKRATSFFISIMIAYIVFNLIGYSAYSFGVFLIFFVAISYLLKFNEHIVVNSVLITHFLIESSMNKGLIINEILIMFIGAGIGIVLNLFIPNNIKLIRQDQIHIEEQMRLILVNMADNLVNLVQNKSSILIDLRNYVNDAINRASSNFENNLINDTSYYLQYMIMRKNQLSIIDNIEQNINNLTFVPLQSYSIAELLKHISSKFHEYNNALGLLEELNNLKEKYRVDILPQSREEFENRAILFQILNSVERLLVIKKEFVLNLNEYQIKKYWRS